jgi:acyl carrier protein
MSFENQDYKLEVLKYAINESIDRLLPNISEDALSIILYQTNEVVWRVATEIYTKSGHQIDFVFIRDILNLRVEQLRIKIAEEEKIRQEREAIIQAELDAQRLAKKAKEQEELQPFKEKYPDININNYKEFDIFIRIRNIVIEQLKVEEKLIALDYTLLDNWNYFSGISGSSNEDNYLDLVEFVMAIEEEFDIEIPDEEGESFFGCSIRWLISFILQKIE